MLVGHLFPWGFAFDDVIYESVMTRRSVDGI